MAKKGRPKSEGAKRTITFILPYELWDALKTKSVINKTSMTSVLVKAAQQYVKG